MLNRQCHKLFIGNQRSIEWYSAGQAASHNIGQQQTATKVLRLVLNEQVARTACDQIVHTILDQQQSILWCHDFQTSLKRAVRMVFVDDMKDWHLKTQHSILFVNKISNLLCIQ